MSYNSKIYILLLLILLPIFTSGQEILKFEHIGSNEGLSQNTVLSILCDNKGFLWLGTMNGLNRYDGKDFKIFKSNNNSREILTNNRISKLWLDEKGYIWVQTYDGFYHLFNQQKETFTTYPSYSSNIEERNSNATIFCQYDSNTIIIGTSASGVYILMYDEKSEEYKSEQILMAENGGITNNHITKSHKDYEGNIWIQCQKGLNLILKKDIESLNFNNITQFKQDISFTSAVAENEDYILFGTTENGISAYNKKSGNFKTLNKNNTPQLNNNYITHIEKISNNKLIIGIKDSSPLVADRTLTNFNTIKFHGKELVDIYLDKHNQVWLTGTNLGLTRFDAETLETRFYQLTPSHLQSVTDQERHYFYEDSNDNLWIGLHGSGLASYNRKDDSFKFYRSKVNDINSISSNIVHCITEDLSGQLWLGTGQYIGGLERVIAANQAFKHTLPIENPDDIAENVVRFIYQDQKENIWVSTKGGNIHLYNRDQKKIGVLNNLILTNGEKIKSNTYSILIDRDHYIWIATKGNGLFISHKPLNQYNNILKDIKFHNYINIPNDSKSLANNNLYSLAEDGLGQIWIATFGGGVSRATKQHNNEIHFTNITNRNSNLSSNQARYVKIDSKGNLWIATTFGINLLANEQLSDNHFRFKHFLHSASNKNSLSYNDVFQIYEDTSGNLWFGTSGGGVDCLSNLTDSTAIFTSNTTLNGLSNDVVYSIIEDKNNNIWFGTENGISYKTPLNTTIEIYNQNNGIAIENFSEAAICRLYDGRIIIGGNNGYITINTTNIKSEEFNAQLELINLQLFNKDVMVNTPQSPLTKTISFTDKIELKHNQSSISIDYINLDLQNPNKLQYAYIMQGLESNWNYVGNNRRAVYTNLKPGNYTFKLKSTNRNGNWIDNERTLQITITPPWYMTIPAYIIYSILIIFVIIVVTRTLNKIQRYRNDLEVEKKLNEVKLQFFTNISHEIRTPLTLIIAPLEDILKLDLPQKVITNLRIIRQNANRMLQLTNQILDFRKIQNHKMTLKVSEINIAGFTQSVYESFIPLAEHKHINYTFIHNNTVDNVWVDPSKLDIIIYNLISNALKFTPENKQIKVVLTGDDKYTLLTVEDQGPGIPPQAIPDLFTRYTILSSGQFAGTGIGLSLSYELAKLHNAELLIESTVGVGTAFTLKLKNGNSHLKGNSNITIADKYEPQNIGTQHIDNELEIEEETQTPSKKILVVEDNHEIQQYICQSLQHKFNCIKASDGEEGLRLTAEMHPDLIITDIMMPNMDGITMMKSIKNNFSISHIPIIALTAKSSIHSEIEGIESGADAYIHKPFNTTHLLATIDNLIRQRENLAQYFKQKQETKEEGIIQPSINITSKDEQFINELIKYVEDNYKTEFNIDSVAENFAMSRTVLYNKIKALTSMSPLEFVRQIKLQIAKQLLLKGYNVSEVAFEVGYSDVKYFSRQFKAQHGISPSQVKK